MPRLLVDLLFFDGRQGGTETVTREIYARLPQHVDWEFVGLAGRELAAEGAPWFPGRLIDSGLSTASRAQWAWGELTAVARAARNLHADVIHSPANFGPRRTPVPLVLTVHDVLSFQRPEFLPSRLQALPTRALLKGAARAATRVITVSEASCRAIVATLHLSEDRVTVVHPGAAKQPAAATIAEDRHPAHLLSIGNRMPHKNFPRLLQALERIPAERRPRLTITGSHGDDPLRSIVEQTGLEAWVDLRGWIAQNELEDLYARCTAVVFPTLFEGFGLPVLEAMSRGCPVLCSDLPVLREVGGDALRYFDPEDPAAMARVIDEAVHDAPGRAVLARRGLERAPVFSWEAAAAGTAAVLDSALDRG